MSVYSSLYGAFELKSSSVSFSLIWLRSLIKDNVSYVESTLNNLTLSVSIASHSLYHSISIALYPPPLLLRLIDFFVLCILIYIHLINNFDLTKPTNYQHGKIGWIVPHHNSNKFHNTISCQHLLLYCHCKKWQQLRYLMTLSMRVATLRGKI